jgi:hypothetical protein
VGDVLCEINGVGLRDGAMSPHQALIGLGGQQVSLALLSCTPPPSHVASAVDGVAAALGDLFLHGDHAGGRAAVAPDDPPVPSAGKKKKKKKGSGGGGGGGGGGGAERGGRRDGSRLPLATNAAEGVMRRVTVRAVHGDRYARYVDAITARRAWVNDLSPRRP